MVIRLLTFSRNDILLHLRCTFVPSCLFLISCLSKLRVNGIQFLGLNVKFGFANSTSKTICYFPEDIAGSDSAIVLALGFPGWYSIPANSINKPARL